MSNPTLNFYELPIRQTTRYGQWQHDKNMNFVFQFEPFYIDNNYDPAFLDIKEKITNSLNDFDHKPIEGEWEVKNSIDLYYNGRHIITIRGWGNLTGVGAHNLPSETAAKIQDDFVKYFLWKVGGIQ